MGLLLLFSPNLTVPGLDEQADEYFSQSITKAGVAYATCRVMNGSISVLQESQLQVEPAGIGLSIAVGQALDPINDMIERTSNVLVTSITSLGVQKLVYEISVSIVPRMLGSLLLLFSLLILIPGVRFRTFQMQLAKMMILLLIARLCLPLSALANTYLSTNYIEPEINSARTELALGSAQLDRFTEFTLPEVDGFKKTMENSAVFIKRKSLEFKETFISLTTHAGAIVENLLALTFLYIGLFLVQVILLPLLMFWGMAKTANALLHTNIPMLVRITKESDASRD